MPPHPLEGMIFFITKNIYYFKKHLFILIEECYFLSTLGLKYRFQTSWKPRLRKRKG